MPVNTSPSESFPATERTRVRRLPQRAAYDRETVAAILDANLVCHLGFVAEGQPFVLPTLYARVGDDLLLHGSSRNRTLGALAAGAEVCLAVTSIDGLVLARSAFHHSVNYRSVTLFGRARALEGEGEKLAALRAFTERLYPGRWDEVRQPNVAELRATLVLTMPLAEAVAKVRTGGPLDDEDDLAWPVWAGVVPLELVARTPVADAHVPDGLGLREGTLVEPAPWHREA